MYEDNGIYRDFDYSKNNYFFKYNLKNIYNSGFGVYYKLDYSQLYYNEFFTEYDSNNLENNIGIKYNFYKKKITLSVDYGYKISDADGIDEELANTLPGDNYGISKNLSYRANKFAISSIVRIPIKSKGTKKNKKRKTIKYGITIKYEQRYYDSEIIEDIYHVNREDYILNLRNKISYNFSKDITMSIFHKYERRDTESELYSTVETGKSYSFNEIGLGLIYGF